MTQKNFGYETIGSSTNTLSSSSYEAIRGTLFTITENGTADSITVALKRAAAGSNNAKCAIYRHSDLKLIGATQQVLTAMTTSFAWKTLPFADPKPNLTKDTEYILVAWADYTNKEIYLAYNTGDPNVYHYRTDLAYNSFPDPFGTLIHGTNKFSIYCTYTVAGPPTGWRKLQYFSEPPTSGQFNKLKFASEPPVSGAFNKLLYEGE